MRQLIICLAGVLALSCTSFEPFTFIQMSDTQIGFIDKSAGYIHSDSLMKAAVMAANAAGPDLVVITGDLVDNPSNPRQDSIYRTRLMELEAPYYHIPGNHDYLGFTREKQQEYIARRGYDRFSFKHKGCAFIGMDSNCIKDVVEDAEKEQLAWLQKELESARGCKYTLVFLHCPVIRESMDEPEDYFNFSVEKRREYIGLFKQYGVDAVFAGHCHQEYFGEHDGILFFTAGPVGNALGHGTPGYNFVNVGKDGLDVTYIPSAL
ncbi:MAG: metallophosphoesterase [Bacteroidales bacterium]|nr:metallophosphoesterase [Bacteroidales bacterium]